MIFLVFLPLLSLCSQYAPYTPIAANPISSGFASFGVALKDSTAAVFQNPSLLVLHQQDYLSGGAGFTSQGSDSSAVFPNFAYYNAWQQSWGWGIRLRKDFSRSFSRQNLMATHSAKAFFVYSLGDLGFSIDLGPSIVFRYGTQSSYSGQISLAASYTWKSWIFAFSYMHPGKYRFEGYRGSDILTEVLPQRLLVGTSYHKDDGLLYLEAARHFWEKTSFGLNGIEERADFERGLGAELSFSGGYEHCFSTWLPLRLRGGLEWGGAYDADGRNLRSLGVGLGASFLFPKDAKDPDRLGIDFALKDYSVFAKKGGREPETQFSFALNYHFGKIFTIVEANESSNETWNEELYPQRKKSKE